jgi:hypothetical protein
VSVLSSGERWWCGLTSVSRRWPGDSILHRFDIVNTAFAVSASMCDGLLPSLDSTTFLGPRARSSKKPSEQSQLIGRAHRPKQRCRFLENEFSTATGDYIIPRSSVANERLKSAAQTLHRVSSRPTPRSTNSMLNSAPLRASANTAQLNSKRERSERARVEEANPTTTATATSIPLPSFLYLLVCQAL